MESVRQLHRVTVWSRNPEHARAFVARESAGRDYPILAAQTAQAAVADVDLICTLTAAAEPVLCGDWVRAGCHINAVGASRPDARELDTAVIAKARLFVDRRESALKEAGDFLIPKQEAQSRPRTFRERSASC